jgi:hypothetical protein
MDSKDRLNLKKLIDEMNCEDNTENIRKLKHSTLIRDDIRKLDNLKKTHADLRASDVDAFFELTQSECPFLFNNYTEIFYKVMKDELDFKIMSRLLIVLKLIEDGKVDQHEGSAMVGKVLKELYIDSALKRADNLDKENPEEVVEKVEGREISWKEYKKMCVEKTI